MNFRVNLAVALAAALSFACADKQATIPELEEAMNAPPGRVTVGLYKMTVTPVQGPNGISFAQQIIPVGRDGSATTNPPGTVQVQGQFGGIVTTAPGCAGVNAITAPVRITNFMVDPLRNVWADVINMSGNTGNTACNSSSSLTSEGFYLPADMSQGIWKYPNLAGSTRADGSLAGGTGLPTATGGVWAFRYVTATPFQFYFAIQADDQSPTLGFADPAGPNLPLTWSSTVAASTQLEICTGTPAGGKGSACVGTQSTQTFAGTGVGPWTYSFAPTGLVQGTIYHWRARNVFAAGAGTMVSDWQPFTYNATTPAIVNATFLANLPANLGGLAELTWNTVASQTDTYAVLCAGPCPATRPPPPVPPALPNPAILFDGPVTWDLVTPGHYALDVTALLVTDLSTTTYYDPAIVYDWRVYDYDGFSPAPAYAAPHSTGTITITPVLLAPAVVGIPPATFSLTTAPTWTISWTADPIFTSTTVDICSPNCADPLATIYAAGVAVPKVAGGYSLDLKLPLVTNAGANPVLATETFELVIYNPDLYTVWGTSVAGTIAP